MKRLVSGILAGVAAVCVLACRTSTAFPHESECGNPAYESMAWASFDGVVSEVTSPNTFRMRGRVSMKGAPLRDADITLPNLGPPFHPEAQERLRKLIEGRQVSVFVNIDPGEPPRQMTGEVHVKAVDVSHQLLSLGMAAFLPEAGYTLSSYSECLNGIAERDARASRVGIWEDLHQSMR